MQSLIALEDLNVQGMIRNRKLSKHIADASWGTFVKFLEYKADWDDKQVVRINLSDNTGEAEIRPEFQAQALKPEAH